MKAPAFNRAMRESYCAIHLKEFRALEFNLVLAALGCRLQLVEDIEAMKQRGPRLAEFKRRRNTWGRPSKDLE